MGNESHPKKKLRMLSLCAGIGGADLAAEATGAIEVVGQVEINPFCQAVLAKHWPNVKRMNDIREVKGHEFGTVDIIVGGIPCQPHSLAGKRQSSTDERNLWPEFYRIIRKIKPRWALVENVLGLLSSERGAFFGGILRDLADAGYDAEWHVLRASDVGAPHERKRVFLVAYLPSVGGRTRWTQSEKQQWTPNTHSNGQTKPMAHTLDARCATTRDISDPQISKWEESGWEQSTDRVGRSGESVAYANSERCKECDSTTGQLESGIRRSSDGIPSQLDEHRWPARPGEAQKAGEPTRTITEKIPFRNKRLEALGNAIVPQQIYPLFNAIVNVEYMEYVA